MTRTCIGAQGELRVFRIDALPDGIDGPEPEKIGGAYVLSHSEKGHHHVIGGDVTVIERTKDVPPGLRILYAIVREPTTLRQTAAEPHDAIALAPGVYEIRRDREYDPFREMARAVRD